MDWSDYAEDEMPIFFFFPLWSVAFLSFLTLSLSYSLSTSIYLSPSLSLSLSLYLSLYLSHIHSPYISIAHTHTRTLTPSFSHHLAILPDTFDRHFCNISVSSLYPPTP